MDAAVNLLEKVQVRISLSLQIIRHLNLETSFRSEHALTLTQKLFTVVSRGREITI